ncbi:predicted protein [Botrytis cinerea T4]|uniref:Uncharacterized protein n=1 Tax=Botryotinia fuckeliana (strain T4) TaxID=999810 RepID=G2YD17_BOTF4|nr:predicted protein [Botrytis cinerea T4]
MPNPGTAACNSRDFNDMSPCLPHFLMINVRIPRSSEQQTNERVKEQLMPSSQENDLKQPVASIPYIHGDSI